MGVARQYCGTAGRVENCQIGVLLTYASVHGHTLLDRELYLPTRWTDDPERCRQAGVPPARTFATKPELARQILARACAAGVRFAAIAGDSVSGDDRPRRQWLEAQHQAYVLAIAPVAQLWVGHESCTHAELLVRLATLPWERHSCGAGSQGPRWYDWQRLALNDPPPAGFKRWVVFRRSGSDPPEVTAYRAFAPVGTPRAARCAWSVGAGRLRRASRPARARVGWTSTRCVAGPAGSGISPWRCGRKRF